MGWRETQFGTAGRDYIPAGRILCLPCEETTNSRRGTNVEDHKQPDSGQISVAESFKRVQLR